MNYKLPSWRATRSNPAFLLIYQTLLFLRLRYAHSASELFLEAINQKLYILVLCILLYNREN